MFEFFLWSLLVGSLGTEALLLGSWLRFRQVAAEKQKCEEEETLTRLKFEDNNSMARGENLPNNNSSKSGTKEAKNMGWEYKIVRANSDLFRKPEIFQKLCREEAEAGWVLLEKLDDRRVRFKRLLALREKIDLQALTFDPYRCHYGSSSNWITWVGAAAFLFAITLPSYLGFVLVSNTIDKKQELNLPATVFDSSPSSPDPIVPEKQTNQDEASEDNYGYPEESYPTNDYDYSYPQDNYYNEPEEPSNNQYDYRY